MSAKITRQNKKQSNEVDSSFSLKKVIPITDTQKDVIDAFNEDLNLVLIGSAGTGKTFLSIYLALKSLMTNKNGPNKIVIIRSIVSTRDVGFLPGTLKEKIAVYEEPYKAIFSELYGRGDAYEILEKKGLVEFCSTSYLRGTTINDAIVILDEFQNCNFAEIDTVISRLGKNSKFIACGDIMQTDLIKNKWDVTGLPDFINIVDTIDSFDIIEFTTEDFVRSGLVKSYILAKNDYFDKNKNRVDTLNY